MRFSKEEIGILEIIEKPEERVERLELMVASVVRTIYCEKCGKETTYCNSSVIGNISAICEECRNARNLGSL